MCQECDIVHLLIGVLGIAAASSGMARLYNQVIGVVYLLLAALGFIPALIANGVRLGLVSINLADNLLHLVGAAAVYVGFVINLVCPLSHISLNGNEK